VVAGRGASKGWKLVFDIVEERRSQVESLCREFGVRRLDVFGSVLDESFDPATSDIDVLVDFADSPGFDYFGSYFGLKEGLEALFGRPVDVVTVTSILNPYFRDHVMRTRRFLYAA
jgi:predicted nucleotidyltransferase